MRAFELEKQALPVSPAIHDQLSHDFLERIVAGVDVEQAFAIDVLTPGQQVGFRSHRGASFIVPDIPGFLRKEIAARFGAANACAWRLCYRKRFGDALESASAEPEGCATNNRSV